MDLIKDGIFYSSYARAPSDFSNLEDNIKEDDIKRVFGPEVLCYVINLTSGHIDFLPRLPEKIILKIILYLNLDDFDRLAQVNKQFFNFCQDEKLWQRVFQKHHKCKTIDDDLTQLASKFSWRQLAFTNIIQLRALLRRQRNGKLGESADDDDVGDFEGLGDGQFAGEKFSVTSLKNAISCEKLKNSGLDKIKPKYPTKVFDFESLRNDFLSGKIFAKSNPGRLGGGAAADDDDEDDDGDHDNDGAGGGDDNSNCNFGAADDDDEIVVRKFEGVGKVRLKDGGGDELSTTKLDCNNNNNSNNNNNNNKNNKKNKNNSNNNNNVDDDDDDDKKKKNKKTQQQQHQTPSSKPPNINWQRKSDYKEKDKDKDKEMKQSKMSSYYPSTYVNNNLKGAKDSIWVRKQQKANAPSDDDDGTLEKKKSSTSKKKNVAFNPKKKSEDSFNSE
ncbi:hypothetical protein HELRODRAFT_175432 [Helobdella robusta]|uniref:F-box domain-containing protein n=1 Tax=Helobdella robusta TaxID=6412 RepID=T1F993_HELRO|nr:hypothetical protein HELRODRAFT_175432 [Helobdella robusta]ESO00934.1 hypothetical protein HELRODRAFT_175432 [Helobdella robusta]